METKNWPFLTLTTRRLAAAARSKSVCRQRNAGICTTSQTAATTGTWALSWTSVRTGNPYSFRTRASNSSPAFRPVPRGPASEVRLALSNEPLKTIRNCGCSRAIAVKPAATARQTSSLSSEQGPAMSRSFAGSKSTKKWLRVPNSAGKAPYASSLRRRDGGRRLPRRNPRPADEDGSGPKSGFARQA